MANGAGQSRWPLRRGAMARCRGVSRGRHGCGWRETRAGRRQRVASCDGVVFGCEVRTVRVWHAQGTGSGCASAWRSIRRAQRRATGRTLRTAHMASGRTRNWEQSWFRQTRHRTTGCSGARAHEGLGFGQRTCAGPLNQVLCCFALRFHGAGQSVSYRSMARWLCLACAASLVQWHFIHR